MNFYEASADIQAAPAVIWPILIDGPGMSFNQFAAGLKAEAERRAAAG